jgi:hypothetical protein
LFINPTRLVHRNLAFALSLRVFLLALHVLFAIFVRAVVFLSLAWYGHNGINIMDIQTDDKGDVFLKLERAIKGRKRR